MTVATGDPVLMLERSLLIIKDGAVLARPMRPAVRALQRSNGNAGHAARMLGISRPTPYNLMSKHELLVEAKNV